MKNSERKFTSAEREELFRLILRRILLNTKAEVWKQPPNEFISLSIPEELQKLVSSTENPTMILNEIIQNLVIKAVSDMTKTTPDIQTLDNEIQTIICNGITEQ